MKRLLVILAAGFFIAGCSGSTSSTPASDGTTGGGGTSGCTYTNNTTETATVSSLGCALRTRDTSSCLASRQAQGLTGFWLDFSCAVTLTKSGTSVYLVSQGVPDHKSHYFGSTHACYETFNTTGGRHSNPNTLAVLSLNMQVPYTPAAKALPKTAMALGGVGMAVNGVLIFNNQAGPGDNIYDEATTFDSCEGHPANTHYHYHIEPPAISQTDSEFLGVARDGFPIYGRQDSSGTPTLDAYGGHTGPLPNDSSTTMYHYHTRLVSGTNGSGGAASAYFMATSSYYGTPGTTCTNCIP